MWAAASLPAPELWPATTIRTARPPLRRHSMSFTSSGKTGGGDLDFTGAIKSDVPRGADVLKALERAEAQKAAAAAAAAAAKRRKKMETCRKREGSSSVEPPLCIKPEWGDRLEELQTRLQQLMMS